MLPPALLPAAVATLFIKYPKQTLQVVVSILLLLVLLVASFAWRQQHNQQAINALTLKLSYAPSTCGEHKPLQVQLTNTQDRALDSLSWQVAAYRQGDDLNVAQNLNPPPHYHAQRALAAGQTWTSCISVPPLRAGYHASSLQFKAEQLNGKFL